MMIQLTLVHTHVWLGTMPFTKHDGFGLLGKFICRCYTDIVEYVTLNLFLYYIPQYVKSDLKKIALTSLVSAKIFSMVPQIAYIISQLDLSIWPDMF